jgi:hypothetical protein
LEIIGGFTGPAGKQMFEFDLSRLPASKAAEIARELRSIPQSAWGSSFLAPHPKSWDFRHVLQVKDEDGTWRQVEFNRNQGPPELTRLVDRICEIDPGDAESGKARE